MNVETRFFVAASALVLGLIALTFFIKPATVEPVRLPAVEAKPEQPFAAASPKKQIRPATPEPVAGTASPAPVAEPALEDEDQTQCNACRERLCTDYKGSGVNLVEGCYTKVDPSQGADITDPSFLADCQAVVSCAREHKCALSRDGAAGCYCGSATIDDCIEYGPAGDSPCLEEWRRAARSNDHREISLRFSDLKYPAGWANFLIECDFDDCKDKCAS